MLAADEEEVWRRLLIASMLPGAVGQGYLLVESHFYEGLVSVLFFFILKIRRGRGHQGSPISSQFCGRTLTPL